MRVIHASGRFDKPLGQSVLRGWASQCSVMLHTEAVAGKTDREHDRIGAIDRLPGWLQRWDGRELAIGWDSERWVYVSHNVHELGHYTQGDGDQIPKRLLIVRLQRPEGMKADIASASFAVMHTPAHIEGELLGTSVLTRRGREWRGIVARAADILERETQLTVLGADWNVNYLRRGGKNLLDRTISFDFDLVPAASKEPTHGSRLIDLFAVSHGFVTRADTLELTPASDHKPVHLEMKRRR